MTEYKWEIIEHGVEHGQYFQGCGVAFTDWTSCVTGVGDTPLQAGEAALEQFYASVVRTEISTEQATALEMQIEALPDVFDAHVGCREVFKRVDTRLDYDRWHEGCELAYRVSIRWRHVDGQEFVS